MRTFDTGATRDSDDTKLDFEGFLSHPVIVRFAEYMNKHRVQADGNLRDSDNWQKGIPMDAYMKSAFRHFMDVWALHRGNKVADGVELEDSLCALLFNIMGYTHEALKKSVGIESKFWTTYPPQSKAELDKLANMIKDTMWWRDRHSGGNPL